MYLVDTSVWIDYLRGRDTAHAQLLDELLQNPLAVGLTDFIYMEVVQGVRDAPAGSVFIVLKSPWQATPPRPVSTSIAGVAASRFARRWTA